MHQLYHGCEWSLELGRTDEAEAYARDALRIAAGIHDRQLTVYLLALLAATAAAQGKHERAGRIWAAVEAEEAHGPVGQWEAERDAYAARVVTRNDVFDRGRAAGSPLSLSEAVEYALS